MTREPASNWIIPTDRTAATAANWLAGQLAWELRLAELRPSFQSARRPVPTEVEALAS